MRKMNNTEHAWLINTSCGIAALALLAILYIWG